MSLGGRRVLVTRPRELAQGLARRIEAAGGRAVLFPAIEIEPLPQTGRVGRYDVVVFVSPTAVMQGARWIGAGETTLAVGAGTAGELARRGVKKVAFPSSSAGSESLLDLPQLEQVAGKRVLIVRGQGGRALLGETLAARGAHVSYAECYRRVRPLADAAPLLADWVDAVTVSSGEALGNLVAMLGEAGRERLRRTPLFVPHRRVADQAAALGARKALLAGPGDDQVIERLVAYFSP